MATPPEFVEEQWKKWSEANPSNKFEHIDEDQMKEILIKDLTYASQMDVREYTLYQKWCEVKERYPVQDVSTLWGSEVQMINPEQKILVEKVKSNFWVPQEPDDFVCGGRHADQLAFRDKGGKRAAIERGSSGFQC